MKHRLTFIGTAFATLLILGCGDPVITDIGPGAGAGEPGGSVVLSLSTSSFGDSAFASASFIKAIQVTGGGSTGASGDTQPIDTCEKMESGTGGTTGGSATVTWFDVGPTVDLRGGTSTVSLTRTETGGTISYAPDGLVDASTIAAGTSYDVELAGSTDVQAQSWPAMLRLPGVPDVTSPDLEAGATMTGGSDFAVEWSTAGVAEVQLLVGGASLWICRVADDGAFDIPSATVDDVDASGILSLSAVDVDFATLEGRRVTLIGSAGTSGTYSKN